MINCFTDKHQCTDGAENCVAAPQVDKTMTMEHWLLRQSNHQGLPLPLGNTVYHMIKLHSARRCEHTCLVQLDEEQVGLLSEHPVEEKIFLRSCSYEMKESVKKTSIP